MIYRKKLSNSHGEIKIIQIIHNRQFIFYYVWNKCIWRNYLIFIIKWKCWSISDQRIITYGIIVIVIVNVISNCRKKDFFIPIGRLLFVMLWFISFWQSFNMMLIIIAYWWHWLIWILLCLMVLVIDTF